ncbi:MAG: DUF5011 domain-containing protein, partial [Chloroflexi bacterium]
ASSNITVILDNVAPVITLLGGNISVPQGGKFVEPGFKAIDNVDGDITSKVKVVGGPVNTASPVGSVFTLTYNVSDSVGNPAIQKTRVVTVIAPPDTIPPVITLKGPNPVHVEQGTTFTDPGAMVTDNVDKGLVATVTGKVNPAVAGQYILTYTAKDKAGNPAVPVKRIVNVSDTTPPVIMLKGKPFIRLVQGAVFTDPGVTAKDSVDGNLTAKVTTSGGPVDPAAAVGTVFTLKYDVSDAAGNAAKQKTRTIVIVAAPRADWRYPRGNRQATGEDGFAYGLATGTFAEIFKVTAGNGSVARVGDVTGDGINDLIVASSNVLKVFGGNGIQIGRNVTLPAGSDPSSMILEDINGDSVNEILIGSRASATMRINIYKGDGTLLHTLTRTGGADSSMMPGTYLGKGRLAVVYNTGLAKQPRGYAVWDIPASTELWFYQMGPQTFTPSYADTNRDGVMEFVSGVFTPHNGATGNGIKGTGTPTNDRTLATVLLDENGVELLSQLLGANTVGGAKGAGYQKLVDLEGDGIYEIVAVVSHYAPAYPGDAQIRVLNLDGTVRHQVSVGTSSSPYIVLADIDGDGIKEIINTNRSTRALQVYDNMLKKKVVTNVVIPGTSASAVSAGDIDGDGVKELLVKSDTFIRVYNAVNLTEKWNVDITVPVTDVWSADLNGDQKAEMIVTTNDGSIHVFSTALPQAPAAPSRMTALAMDSSRVLLRWRDNSAVENNFVVEQSNGKGAYKQVAKVPANRVRVTVRVRPNQSYAFRVRAVNGAGSSLASKAAVVRVLGKPKRLRARQVGRGIMLKWGDGSVGERGFYIERLSGAGRFVRIGRVGANRQAYTDKRIRPRTRYIYRVRAFGKRSSSSYSNTSVVRTR